jgi:hypothetical protein
MFSWLFSVIVLAQSSQFYDNQPVSSYEKVCSLSSPAEVTIAAVKRYFEGNSQKIKLKILAQINCLKVLVHAI